ncbi:PilL N-terminal domain-containing protein [Chitinivorax sp. PXF-14]|uniref:PilL N-terminal domain-containing protein n=1 Tax=Burkholderia cepacia TaxID=292 RepID=A0A8I1DL92_BURCE|nr:MULTISPECIES: PilL N-terminal domain-containing protein [Burkholderiaceae]MBB0025212.1 pilus assembly protein PilL [Ralstonia pickettii]MBB0036000.1 pilus assembly protein PilL [Ralstonia pickettii]MBB0098540.1 pilus assembly protein PilL [Ralstonia pickettii]MBB0108401.1 pilus assembly protein PilL [Ralstonia pickettii]MBB0129314.1 pilus assembly protein PilL [Ralstonia pickettii]
MQPLICVAHRLAVPAMLAGCVLITGCAATDAASILTADDSPPEPAVFVRTISPEPEPSLIPVARYGRYTLVEMVPEPAQRDLLRQVIEISIPPTLDAGVGDALRHVLLRTGYRLCDAPDAASLFTLPLPAAHLRLGPLPLRDALLALAGPAWELSVDDAARAVCFTRVTAIRASSTSPVAATPASSAPAADPANPKVPPETQP